MSILAVILAAILGTVAYVIERKLYNPVTLFCGVWAFVILFASMHLYGMKEVSEKVYLIIALGIFAFSAGGFLAFSLRKHVYVKTYKEKAYAPFVINYPVVYVVGAIVLVFLVLEAITAFQEYSKGVQMNDLRTSLLGYSDTGYADDMIALREGPYAMIYSFVFLPGAYAVLLVTSIDIIIGKRNIILIIMSFVILVLKNYAEGSRMCLTHLLIYFVLLFLIYKRGVLSERIKKWIKRIVVIVIVGFLVVSSIRFSESKKTMVQQLYMYFTCPVPLFDHWLEMESASGVYTYGAVSLLGILRLPFNILKIFGIFAPSLVLNNANEIATSWDKFITLGPNLYYNSFVTLFMYFYKDAGIFGVILGSSLFGYIVSRVYKRLVSELENENVPLRLTYVYVLLGCFVIQSYIRFFFSRADYAVILFYALIFFKRSTVETEVEEESEESDENSADTDILIETSNEVEVTENL